MAEPRKTGQEPFHAAGEPLGTQLLDFWRWCDSDVLSNTLRGRLAEYLVATALGTVDGIRIEWDSFDLKTSDGITVEVKSGAYLQSWTQKRPSRVEFGIAPTRAWNPQTGKREGLARRQAQVYVFCLLGEPDQVDVDPLDVTQWRFYVIATEKLDRELRGQQKMALSTLLRLEPEVVGHDGIAAAVYRAVRG